MPDSLTLQNFLQKVIDPFLKAWSETTTFKVVDFRNVNQVPASRGTIMLYVMQFDKLPVHHAPLNGPCLYVWHDPPLRRDKKKCDNGRMYTHSACQLDDIVCCGIATILAKHRDVQIVSADKTIRESVNVDNDTTPPDCKMAFNDTKTYSFSSTELLEFCKGVDRETLVTIPLVQPRSPLHPVHQLLMGNSSSSSSEDRRSHPVSLARRAPSATSILEVPPYHSYSSNEVWREATPYPPSGGSDAHASPAPEQQKNDPSLARNTALEILRRFQRMTAAEEAKSVDYKPSIEAYEQAFEAYPLAQDKVKPHNPIMEALGKYIPDLEHAIEFVIIRGSNYENLNDEFKNAPAVLMATLLGIKSKYWLPDQDPNFLPRLKAARFNNKSNEALRIEGVKLLENLLVNRRTDWALDAIFKYQRTLEEHKSQWMHDGVAPGKA